MAAPGALAICRGLNRKCVKHTGNGPNVTNTSRLLDLFLLFASGREWLVEFGNCGIQ